MIFGILYSLYRFSLNYPTFTVPVFYLSCLVFAMFECFCLTKIVYYKLAAILTLNFSTVYKTLNESHFYVHSTVKYVCTRLI